LNQIINVDNNKTYPNKTENSDQPVVTNDAIKEPPKEMIIEKVEPKNIPNLNLANARTVELKSHFDVIRKLGYLPQINALVSVSEVQYYKSGLFSESMEYEKCYLF
jgi:hypothetical protein